MFTGLTHARLLYQLKESNRCFASVFDLGLDAGGIPHPVRMIGPKLTVSYHLLGALPTPASLTAAVLSALPVIGRSIETAWKQATSGTVLPGMTQPVDSQRYRQGITLAPGAASPFDSGVTAGAVIWVPASGGDANLPDRIEEGYGAFDMKPGLLASTKARETTDGRPYTIVPFFWSASGKRTRGGRAIPAWARAFAENMDRSKQRGERVDGRAKITWSARPLGRLTESTVLSSGVLSRRQEQAARRHFAQMRDTGRTSPYEGLVRIEFDYERESQSKLMSFRVVSENSPAHKWRHPGQPAHPVMKAVAREGEKLMEIILAKRLEALGD